MTVLEFIRRKSGLSQVQVGRMIGTHPSAIVQIERGHRKAWPKIRRQLSEVLNVPENRLFDDTGSPKHVD